MTLQDIHILLHTHTHIYAPSGLQVGHGGKKWMNDMNDKSGLIDEEERKRVNGLSKLDLMNGVNGRKCKE